MDTAAYLARIGIDEPVDVTLDDLERLQRAHLTHVPFENLDIFHRRGVSTDTDRSTEKIVVRGRGGWCYELNGAFGNLLAELGFEVRWLGARVLPATHTAPDHLALQVTLDRLYLVDVGFGDSFIRPLPLDSEDRHDGGNGHYLFAFEDDLTTLCSVEEEGMQMQYEFGSAAHTAADFEWSSNRLQTEEGLQWTQSPFATRLLDGGPDRVTLVADRIKFRRDGAWIEQPIASGDEWDELLDQWFSMTP